MSTAGVRVSLGELAKLQGTVKGLRLTGLGRPLSTRAGSHMAAHKGRGLEFAEVRHYQAGDDVRTIDWRVTARRGKPHTKLFQEEKERPVCILADLAPGMYFGTRCRFKSVQVARLAAAAAWAALQNGDRIAGVVIGEDRSMVLPPRPRRSGVMALLHALEQLQPLKPAPFQSGRLDQGLARLHSLVRPGSLVLLLSDFREMGGQGGRLLTRIGRRSDLLAGLVYDRLEAEPPRQGRFGFASLEKRLVLDMGRSGVQRDWQESFRLRAEQLRELGRKNNFPVLEISTEMEPFQVLHQGITKLRRKW
ncbi:MAG: DUF58 domain-containing protein [Deltaproteobacteria bacterium]|jgi:uncharacterized protein (DUF58 family)